MIRTISWPDKSLTAEICCAAGVLQDLDIAAVDGLLAMPRIGLGVGGLLLGRRWNKRIEVLRALSIPCSHALGTAFVLTSEELPAAGWQGGTNGSSPDSQPTGSELAGYELVGCYWSKPNGSFVPTDYDHVLFRTLCPEPWQVALIIRPSLGSVTTAAIGLRGDGDKLVLGVPVELVPKAQEAAEEEESDPAFASASSPGAEPEPSELMRSVEAFAAKIEAAPAVVAQLAAEPALPVAMPRSGTLFGLPEREDNTQRKNRWPTLLLALVILLAILATSAFFTQDYWLPRWRSAFGTYLPESGISK